MSNIIQYFSIDDATYAYEISGEGIPIVLLHGFTGSKSTWSEFVDQWKDQFQLIIVDLPGHGQTLNKTPRTIDECCSDLAKLFEHLQLTTFHLVGYSMGGRTALLFALLYPHFIASLVLESASPGILEKQAREERVRTDEKLAQKIETEGIDEFVAFWENIPLFASQKEMPKIARQKVQRERLAQTTEGLAMSLRAMGTGCQPALWEELGQLTKPVLLIVGELDPKFIEMNKRMKASFLKANLIVVEKVGHAIHVENPEKFGKLITNFIMKSDSQGGF